MAFTGRLGTTNSQLGQIELGFGGSSTVSASFTADAFIQQFLTANAIVKVTQSASFTADAVINAGTVSASFTANAVLFATRSASFTGDAIKAAAMAASFTASAITKRAQTASFTANAELFAPDLISLNAIIRRERRPTPFTANARVRVIRSASFTTDARVNPIFTANAILLKTQEHRTFDVFAWVAGAGVVGFTADAVVKRNQTTSFTADAVKRQGRTASFTANAWKRKIVSRSLTADAYVQPSGRQEHARTGPHTGVDTDLDQIIAWAFDRYLRGENLQSVLSDIDARLTARETGAISYRRLLPAAAIVRASQSKSLLLDAYYVIRQNVSFLADAFINPYFTGRAVIKAFMSTSFVADAEIYPQRFRSDAWINNPNITLWDDIQMASPWPIDTKPIAAIINTADMTGDAVNDPDYWDAPGNYRTAWAYFTLTETKTVILDTIGTDGDTVLELWQGVPGSWPDEPLGYSDDDVDNLPGMGYSSAEYLEVELEAGTYWVLVHMFNEGADDFDMLLQMQTTI